MTLEEFNQVIVALGDCDDFLQGKAHSNKIAEIAKAAAQRAVLERRENLLDRLRDAGLSIEV